MDRLREEEVWSASVDVRNAKGWSPECERHRWTRIELGRGGRCNLFSFNFTIGGGMTPTNFAIRWPADLLPLVEYLETLEVEEALEQTHIFFEYDIPFMVEWLARTKKVYVPLIKLLETEMHYMFSTEMLEAQKARNQLDIDAIESNPGIGKPDKIVMKGYHKEIDAQFAKDYVDYAKAFSVLKAEMKRIQFLYDILFKLTERRCKHSIFPGQERVITFTMSCPGVDGIPVLDSHEEPFKNGNTYHPYIRKREKEFRRTTGVSESTTITFSGTINIKSITGGWIPMVRFSGKIEGAGNAGNQNTLFRAPH